MVKSQCIRAFWLVSLLGFSISAMGHGLMVEPPARNAHCGLNEPADRATTPACVEAAAVDSNGMYQFMSVLTHDIGRTGGTSNNVCGFDSETWQGGATPWDLPLDWPTTAITSGETTITWNISWGPHWDDTEEFRYWITRSGFDYQVGTPLSWADFESEPFCVLNYSDANPNANPDVVAEKGANLFHTTCNVPSRSGRHVIYGEWGRNYYTYERFHGCIDVTFGPVTSSSSSSNSSSSITSSSSSSSSSNSSSSSLSSSLSSSSLSSSSSSSSSTVSSSTPSGNANLMCDYVVVNEWNTGFVADIRLTNTSDNIVEGWEVDWTYSDGTQIEYLWNADYDSSGGTYSASGVQWNSSVLPGQTVVFGMVGTKGSEAAQSVTVAGEHCQ